MNKKSVVIVCVCVLLLIAAVALCLIINGSTQKPVGSSMAQGADEIVLNSNSETAVIVDFDTGSVIQTPESKSQASSAVSQTAGESDASVNSGISETVSTSETESEDSSAAPDLSSQTSSVDPERQTMSGFPPWQ